MVADACPGVIVSSDRFADIEPYARHCFKFDPEKKFNSIFPWHFPHNAAREEEEAYLRRFFTPEEIHMQGGAGGGGKGYRFLKQVWYSIALYNFEQRVPAMEQWFWQQPANLSLLTEPSMHAYVFADGAAPSTFFQREEMDMYGVKFLEQVVPRIQHTARVYLDQKQLGREVNVLEVSRYFTQHILDCVRARPSQSAQQPSPGAAAKVPEHTNEPVIVSSDPPARNKEPVNASSLQFAPPSSSAHAQSRAASDDHTYGRDVPLRVPKNNAYNGKHFDDRSTNYDTRFRHPSDDRNSYPHHPQANNFPLVPTHQGQGPRGVPVEFMPAIPQGQPLQAMQQPFHRGSHQQPHPRLYDPRSIPNQNAMAEARQYVPEQQPIYYSAQAFGDRGHNPAAFSNMSGNRDHYNQDASRGGRGNNRRGSMSGRGRGSNDARMQGSRGRNSFGASDVSSQAPRGEYTIHRGGSGNHAGGSSKRARRQSGVSGSWRSSSDRPQIEPMAGSMEDMPHGRAFSGPDSFQMAPIPHEGFYESYNPPLPQIHHNSPVVQNVARGQHGAGYPTNFVQYSGPHHEQITAQEPDKCGRDWILPEATIARKLIAFDVPVELNAQDLINTFKQYGNVIEVKRISKPPLYKGTRGATSLVLVVLPSAPEARAFLDSKPDTWLDGRRFKVEVSREHWDPTYMQNRSRISSYDHSHPGVNPRKDSTTSIGHQFAPTILRHPGNEVLPQGGAYAPGNAGNDRQIMDLTRSKDTTPTPSGASTPKKKKQKNKKAMGEKDKKSKEDLWKKSLAANAEQKTETIATPSADAATSVTTSTEVANANVDHAETATQKDQKREREAAPVQAQQAPMTVQQGEVQSSLAASGPNDDPKLHPVQHEVSKQEGFKQEESAAEKAHMISAAPSTAPAPLRQPIKAEERSSDHDSVVSPIPAAATNTEQATLTATASTKDKPQERTADDQSFRDEAKTETTTKTGEEELTAIASKQGYDIAQHVWASPEHRNAISVAVTSPPLSADSATDSNSVPQDSVVVSSIAESQGNSDSKAVEAAAKEAMATTEDVASDKTLVTSQTGEDTISSITSKPTIHVSTEACTPDLNDTKSDKRSTSGSTMAPNTPAFFTAPNTPAVDHEASVEAETTDATTVPSQEKKVEKPKGPAQTESLSLFSKKKAKKPKAPKKGTLKGKPSNISDYSTDATNESLSRVVSGANTPILAPAHINTVPAAGKKAGEGKAAPAAPAKALKVTKPPKTDENTAPKTATNDGGKPQASIEETPSKRKGNKIGNMLSSLFSGGALSQAPAQDTTPAHIPSSKTSLTDVADQGLPPRSEVKPTDGAEREAKGGSEARDAVTLVADDEAASSSVVLGSPTAGNANYSLSSRGVNQDAGGDVGLGISNGDTGKSKKKKKPRKKKEAAADEQGTGGSLKSPELSDLAEISKPAMFRFGEDKAPPSSPLADDASLSSHQSTNEGTPTPEPKSPAASVMARRFALAQAGNGGIVQSKQPSWKNKKRPLGGRSSEPAVEGEEEEQSQIVTLNLAGSDTSDDSTNAELTPSSNGESNKKTKLYVYIGPGRRSTMVEGDGNGEVKDREAIKELTTQELRRKFGDDSQASTLVETAS
ncbi:hypothetical protein LTR09_002279 [Extremus antarcticus]|uniref:RRM domain-containing protein n=1 Tax=Extremus antarcticus TaxID=702011 RepID=A0AAJ0LW15_9PEZI|nr:hypothetical protein LTR09_002279 [Extremus antarcticus]